MSGWRPREVATRRFRWMGVSNRWRSCLTYLPLAARCACRFACMCLSRRSPRISQCTPDCFRIALQFLDEFLDKVRGANAQCAAPRVQFNEVESTFAPFTLADKGLGCAEALSYVFLREPGFDAGLSNKAKKHRVFGRMDGLFHQVTQ